MFLQIPFILVVCILYIDALCKYFTLCRSKYDLGRHIHIHISYTYTISKYHKTYVHTCIYYIYNNNNYYYIYIFTLHTYIHSIFYIFLQRVSQVLLPPPCVRHATAGHLPTVSAPEWLAARHWTDQERVWLRKIIAGKWMFITLKMVLIGIDP